MCWLVFHITPRISRPKEKRKERKNSNKVCLFSVTCQVIEIPRGSKVKYELDKKTGLIVVKQGDSIDSSFFLVKPYFSSDSKMFCTSFGCMHM